MIFYEVAGSLVVEAWSQDEQSMVNNGQKVQKCVKMIVRVMSHVRKLGDRQSTGVIS